MYNFPLAGFRPLLAFIFLFALILGCRKDNLIIDNPRTDGIRQPGLQFSITAEEAKAYFEKLDLHASNSLNGSNSYSFIGVDPMWNSAFTGYSQSGKEMIVVPLADSSIRTLNDGRADAKLLFTKISADTITAQIILYIADTAYYASNGHALGFNNFSGVFAFFDLTYHFQYGIAMENGAPVSEIDTVGFITSGAALDRYNCWEGGIYVMCDGPVEQVFTSNTVECTAVMFLQGAPCDGTGGGGGGGGGTGGGTGGTGGGGYGTGGSGNANFWSIFYSNTPVNVFLANGGTLPNGLDLAHAQHLVEINQVYHLSQPDLHWLADNILILDAVYSYFINHPAPTGNDLNAIARLIALGNNYGLNPFQQLYLANHLNLVGDIYKFLAAHPNNSTAVGIVSVVVQYNIEFNTLDDLNFIYDNLPGIEEAATSPINPPISIANPMCNNILAFKTQIDSASNRKYAGLLLQNSYFQFNVPGSTPIIIRAYNMRFRADANADTTCLISCPSFAANAINIAVLQTQQQIDSLPSGSSAQNIIAFAKQTMIRRINRQFVNAVRNCNSNYTTDVGFMSGMYDNWDHLPIVDCDAQIVNCN